MRGRNRVARTLLAWMRVASRLPDLRLEPVEVNGGPGVMFRDGRGRLISVLSLEIAGAEIRSISSIVNPDKLAHLGEVADLAAIVGAPTRRSAPRIGASLSTHQSGGTP